MGYKYDIRCLLECISLQIVRMSVQLRNIASQEHYLEDSRVILGSRVQKSYQGGSDFGHIGKGTKKLLGLNTRQSKLILSDIVTQGVGRDI